MHPINNVVSDVQWISTFGEYLDLKSIEITRGFKRLIPPACSF